MNKEITIIELLNKIDKKEKIPKKLKMFEKVYKWDTDYKCYVNVENCADIGLNFDESELHITLEILDEENNEFEDIEELEAYDIYCFDEVDKKFRLNPIINQLIRNQKKIIERLKKDE